MRDSREPQIGVWYPQLLSDGKHYVLAKKTDKGRTEYALDPYNNRGIWKIQWRRAAAERAEELNNREQSK